jgi:hypothetical protein
MLKKTALALFGLVFAMALITPPKANAQVVAGVGVAPFVPRPPYGYVVVQPRPYVYVAPPPYVAYAPRDIYPPYVVSGRVFVGGRSTRDPMLTDMQGRVATGGGGTICGSKACMAPRPAASFPEVAGELRRPRRGIPPLALSPRSGLFPASRRQVRPRPYPNGSRR